MTFHKGSLIIFRTFVKKLGYIKVTDNFLACVAGGISRASAFFSGLMLWSWLPSSEGFGEESS